MKRNKVPAMLAIVITLYLQGACSKGDAEEPERPRADPEQIVAAVSVAEALFLKREDGVKLREAIVALSKVRDSRQRSFDVEWRIAKFNYFLGKQTMDEKGSEAAHTAGRDAGRIALGIEPQRPEGHFWYGANLGELSRKSPLTVGLKSIDEVRKAMNKVIELQPGYQNTTAYDVLGQVEMETRTIGGGSAEKAVEFFNKGLETEKNNINLRLHLAEAYLILKKDAEARKQLDLLLAMKLNPEFPIESRETLEKAKKLLATRF